MSALILAMFLACGGSVIDRAPGKALVCGVMQENAIGGHGATCEWVKVTR